MHYKYHLPTKEQQQTFEEWYKAYMEKHQHRTSEVDNNN